MNWLPSGSVPEWFVLILMVTMYVMGYCQRAMMHSDDPFWHGFRTGWLKVFTLGFYKEKRKEIMTEYKDDSLAGEHVDTVFEKALKYSKDNDESFVLRVNGVELLVTPDTPDFTLDILRDEYDKAGIDIAKKYEQINKEALINVKDKYCNLVETLNTLDWSDQAAILDWLSELALCDNKYLYKNATGIIMRTFQSKGYKPNMHVGNQAHLIEGDMNLYFQWLVGQGLDGISKYGVPHSALIDFKDVWKKKFKG